MSVTLKELNSLPADQARGLLAECCGSSAWVNGMLARRPFRSREDVYKAADEAADELGLDDWLEAFDHHPKIGETKSAAIQGETAKSWSAAEQVGVSAADARILASLAEVNAEYERKFGYIYIVCATGKTADEMLELAQKRLKHSPEKEIRVAADEQRKITRLRLEKLLTPEDS
jgi:OHCU decarboxylase